MALVPNLQGRWESHRSVDEPLYLLLAPQTIDHQTGKEEEEADEVEGYGFAGGREPRRPWPVLKEQLDVERFWDRSNF